jgi:4-hydroxy-3-methylbut-2-en-1-yl diphosphate reductase
LIENFRSIRPDWLEGVKTIALTAGASAPEILVQEAVTYLMEIGFNNVQEVEVMPENVRFGLPPEIADAVNNAPREFVRIEGASVS